MFQELWRQIEAATDKNLPRVITNIAERYDDIMLSHSTIPEEGVEFLVKLFSYERVLNSKGIEHFLLEINVDLIKYTPDQRMKLLQTLIQNAGAVTDQLGRHSIGDFIARGFPAELAFETFFAMSTGNSREKHVAFVGLDVLRMREPKGSMLFKKIENTWSELLKKIGR